MIYKNLIHKLPSIWTKRNKNKMSYENFYKFEGILILSKKLIEKQKNLIFIFELEIKKYILLNFSFYFFIFYIFDKI